MRRDAAVTRDPFAGPRAEYCLGRVALARGKADTAVRRFRRCVAGASPFDQFIVRHLNSMLARAAAAAGDRRAARASGQRSAGYRAACEGAVSPWLTGALSAVPLTPRERQIAALASGGHSDLAIAGQLHISTRTVQTHLAHIYAKLGINRRADLAAHLVGG